MVGEADSDVLEAGKVSCWWYAVQLRPSEELLLSSEDLLGATAGTYFAGATANGLNPNVKKGHWSRVADAVSHKVMNRVEAQSTVSNERRNKTRQASRCRRMDDVKISHWLSVPGWERRRRRARLPGRTATARSEGRVLVHHL